MTNQKLKALHTELKVHDKEAMALKKLLADGMDKEGLREAELRKKFNGIMHSYGMVKPSIKFEDDKKQLKKVSFKFYLKVDIFFRHFKTSTYFDFYVNAVCIRICHVWFLKFSKKKHISQFFLKVAQNFL